MQNETEFEVILSTADRIYTRRTVVQEKGRGLRSGERDVRARAYKGSKHRCASEDHRCQELPLPPAEHHGKQQQQQTNMAPSSSARPNGEPRFLPLPSYKEEPLLGLARSYPWRPRESLTRSHPGGGGARHPCQEWPDREPGPPSTPGC